MTKLRLTVVGIIVALALLVAFAVGYRVAEEQGAERLKVEVAGSLSFDVVVLSHLRSDEMKEAIELLEAGVDQAALTLTPHEDPLVASALGQAKLYRSLFPSSRIEVEKALVDIEMAAPAACRPALRDLVEKGGGG